MKNVLICTWSDSDKVKGGCESIFDDLSEAINGKIKSYTDALRTISYTPLSEDYYRYAVIDRSLVLTEYIKKYEKFFDLDLIITAEDCSYFFDKLKTPYITMFNNPYRTIAEKLFMSGHYNKHEYFEFGEVYVKLQKASAEKAKKNIAVSNFMKEYMENLGIRCDGVLNHGIDTSLFRKMNKYELRKKYGIPIDKKVGIAVTKFHPVKNYHLVARLINEMKDIFWILVFTNPIIVKPKLKNVKIFTNLPRKQMPELYNCADFCINPSVVESFGLVPLEAMACEVPIIVSNTGYFYDYPTYQELNPTGFGFLIKDGGYETYKKAVGEVFNSGYKFDPSMYIEENELDIQSFKTRWKGLIDDL